MIHTVINKKGLLLGILLCLSAFAVAQPNDTLSVQDSISEVGANILAQTPLRWGEPYTPRKATYLSAAIPGLGQAYNNSYWKVPLIYALMGGAGYAGYFFNQQYEDSRAELFAEIDNDPRTVKQSQFTEEQLRDRIDQVQRFRDMAFIGIALVYLLNVAEAHVDAHLYNFSLEDDLQASHRRLEVRPLIISQTDYSGVGIRIVLP